MKIRMSKLISLINAELEKHVEGVLYGRVREERLVAAVERVGRWILRRKSVASAYRLATRADTKNATLVQSEGCISQNLVAAEGLEPPTRGL